MVVIRSVALLLFLNCVFGQKSKTSTALKTIPPACREGPYFVPPVAVNSAESRSICKKYGGRLASINIDNFELTTSLLHGCAGSQQRAWIRSWNGLDYNLDCLALYTGTGHPGGSIDTSCLGKKQPSVCANPIESYDPPPEDTEAVNAIPSIAEGVDSTLASSQGEQESDVAEMSSESENDGWLVDLQQSMFEYRIDPVIN